MTIEPITISKVPSFIRTHDYNIRIRLIISTHEYNNLIRLAQQDVTGFQG